MVYLPGSQIFVISALNVFFSDFSNSFIGTLGNKFAMK